MLLSSFFRIFHHSKYSKHHLDLPTDPENIGGWSLSPSHCQQGQQKCTPQKHLAGPLGFPTATVKKNRWQSNPNKTLAHEWNPAKRRLSGPGWLLGGLWMFMALYRFSFQDSYNPWISQKTQWPASNTAHFLVGEKRSLKTCAASRFPWDIGVCPRMAWRFVFPTGTETALPIGIVLAQHGTPRKNLTAPSFEIFKQLYTQAAIPHLWRIEWPSLFWILVEAWQHSWSCTLERIAMCPPVTSWNTWQFAGEV